MKSGVLYHARIKAYLLYFAISLFSLSSIVSVYQMNHSVAVITTPYRTSTWALVQLQSELHRFLSALKIYHLKGLAHDELMFRYDLLWSRFSELLDAKQVKKLNQINGAKALVSDMFHELKQLEGRVINLEPASPLVESSIYSMARFEPPLMELVNREFSINNHQYKQQDRNIYRMEQLLVLSIVGLLISGGLLIIMLLKENQLNRKKALYDELTGLANRAHLLDFLDKRLNRFDMGEPEQLALFFLDLNRFKEVNDSLGHVVGDVLLEDVGKRLLGLVSEGDLVARLGGDEFAVVQTAFEHQDEVFSLARRIQSAITQEFSIGQHNCYIGASIGVSLFPDYAVTCQELLLQADTAMYEAKRKNTGAVIQFQTWMQERLHRKQRLTEDLRTALFSDQFELSYQPIICLKTQQIYSVEALIRWYHDELGEICAREIMELAEETGLSPQVDSWVIRQACNQLRRWQQDGLTALKLAVNIASSTYRTDILLTLNKALTEYRIDPSCLIVEFKEEVTLSATASHLATLNEMRRIGVALALDNFGLGYSSLSHLQQLPIEYLKVDSSIIADLESDNKSQQLFQHLVGLANSMSLKLICEGVETLRLRKRIDQYSAKLYAQGYLFCRPVPPQRIKQMMEKQLVAESPRRAGERLCASS